MRDRDSTMISWAPGVTIFKGMAGEPPPEPRSYQLTGVAGMSGEASSGSTIKRSMLPDG